jgi:PKD repeat protein
LERSSLCGCEKGTNAAKFTTATFAIAGSYDFTVTVRDAEGLTSTSTVTVTVNQNPTSLTLTPAVVTLQIDGTQLFIADVRDLFGDLLLTPPSVSWTTSGGGTIDANGLFTATAVGGPFFVEAISGALGGSATVTIIGESFAHWQSRNFSKIEVIDGSASDYSDPDHDGLSNLAEYALGMDPHIQNSLPNPVLNDSGLTLTFTRPNSLPDVTYAAESSFDLSHWLPVPIALVSDGPIQTMRVCDPLADIGPNRRFLRLIFTR